MSVYSCVCVCEVSILGEQLLVEAGGAQTTPAQICLVKPIIPKFYWHIRPDICGIFFSLHVSKQQAFCNFCTRVPVVKPLEKSVLNCKWKKKKGTTKEQNVTVDYILQPEQPICIKYVIKVIWTLLHHCHL